MPAQTDAPATPTPAPTVQLVPLATIKIDDRTWPREEIDSERVKLFAELYANDADTVPPIEVFPFKYQGMPKSVYVLVDGRHRVAARKKMRATNIPAVIRDDLRSLDDAYRAACEHSAMSSKPLSARERRSAVRRLLKATPKMSERDIARIVGCSVKTVYNQSHALQRILSEAGDNLSRRANAGTGRPAKTQHDRFIDFLYHRDVGQPSPADIAALRRDFTESPEVRDIAVAWARAVAEAIQPPPASPPASVNYKP